MMRGMKFVWIFAFLPFCLGNHEVSNETCMNVESSYPIDFTTLVDGKERFSVGAKFLIMVAFWYRFNFECVRTR